jgi:mono/diheme cytochrome c family protein
MNRSAKKFISLVTLSAFALMIALIIGKSTQASNTTVTFDAATTFKTKCASCHGLDGSGATAFGKANKLRDLRSAEVQGQTDQQLAEIIGKGKGKMPGYEKSLGADEVKEQVAYIRSIKQ